MTPTTSGPSPWKRLPERVFGKSSKVLFLVLLCLVLMALAYYLGTTWSFRTGAPVNFQTSTLIFKLDGRTIEADGETARQPTEREMNFAEKATTDSTRNSDRLSNTEKERAEPADEGQRTFIERVITNGTRNIDKLRNTETEREETESGSRRSFIEQVITNRLRGGEVGAETVRTPRPNPEPVNPDLLDFTGQLQQILRDLQRNEGNMKTPDKPSSPTEEPQEGRSFIQQVLSNKGRDELSETGGLRASSPSNYTQQILRERGLDTKPVGTDVPPRKNTGRSVTVPAAKDGAVIHEKPSSPSSGGEEIVAPNAARPTVTATATSPTNAQNVPAGPEGSASNSADALPLEMPPKQTTRTEQTSDSKESLQPSPLIKPFHEQRASSGVTYETWHQQRLSDMCGKGWQEQYQQLHEDILSGRREERYLVYSCPGYRQGCCGYGNRLRALASVFYLAVLTGRAFIVDWLLPEPIDRHLTPKGIRWNYTEPIDMCSGPEFRRHYWGSTKSEIRQAQGWILQDSSSFARWFTSVNISAFFEYPVERITTIWYFVEKGVRENPYLMARAKELQITPLISHLPPYALIGCAFDFLFTISDRVEVQLARLRQSFQRPPGPMIGIHVRTGDDQFDYYASDNDRTWNARNITRLLRFFECAANVEKNVFGLTAEDAAAVKWFVATDNLKVKTMARKLFPKKVVTSDLPILHLDILVNSTLSNVTVDCHYTDSTNTTLVCADVEPFNRTIYCANRTNLTMSNVTVFNATEGIVSMLVDHFLLAESDFLVLCDSSFGSAAVGLSMRGSDGYTFGDRGCADITLAQRQKKLQFFKR